eukprot:GFYU01006259.1.p1 GENE.GFYU01006259.1~~GFYU01006259.1.p1  ORF type:complete len:785 (+),score=145.18 GFYU01006259.1:1-2355(+)
MFDCGLMNEVIYFIIVHHDGCSYKYSRRGEWCTLLTPLVSPCHICTLETRTQDTHTHTLLRDNTQPFTLPLETHLHASVSTMSAPYKYDRVDVDMSSFHGAIVPVADVPALEAMNDLLIQRETKIQKLEFALREARDRREEAFQATYPLQQKIQQQKKTIDERHDRVEALEQLSTLLTMRLRYQDEQSKVIKRENSRMRTQLLSERHAAAKGMAAATEVAARMMSEDGNKGAKVNASIKNQLDDIHEAVRDLLAHCDKVPSKGGNTKARTLQFLDSKRPQMKQPDAQKVVDSYHQSATRSMTRSPYATGAHSVLALSASPRRPNTVTVTRGGGSNSPYNTVPQQQRGDNDNSNIVPLPAWERETKRLAKFREQLITAEQAALTNPTFRTHMKSQLQNLYTEQKKVKATQRRKTHNLNGHVTGTGTGTVGHNGTGISLSSVGGDASGYEAVTPSEYDWAYLTDEEDWGDDGDDDNEDNDRPLHLNVVHMDVGGTDGDTLRNGNGNGAGPPRYNMWTAATTVNSNATSTINTHPYTPLQTPHAASSIQKRGHVQYDGMSMGNGGSAQYGESDKEPPTPPEMSPGVIYAQPDVHSSHHHNGNGRTIHKPLPVSHTQSHHPTHTQSHTQSHRTPHRQHTYEPSSKYTSQRTHHGSHRSRSPSPTNHRHHHQHQSPSRSHDSHDGTETPQQYHNLSRHHHHRSDHGTHQHRTHSPTQQHSHRHSHTSAQSHHVTVSPYRAETPAATAARKTQLRHAVEEEYVDYDELNARRRLKAAGKMNKSAEYLTYG